MGAGTRLAVVAAAAALAVALAGCGAGQDASTSRQLPSVPGVNAASEEATVLVRNAHVVFDADGYDVGDDAPVRLWLVNDTRDPIRLTQATSEQAGSVDIGGGVEIPPEGVVDATLTATGVNRPLGVNSDAIETVQPLPLSLAFSNDVEMDLQLTMAPPMEAQPRQQMDLDDH